MNWEIFGSVLGAITGFIGAVWAIVKYYDKKREKKKKQEEIALKEKEKADREYFDEKFTTMARVNETQQKELDKLNKTIGDINEDLREIHEELVHEQEQIDENEMQRLRHEIIDFACRVRNGETITDNQFAYICEVYDRYTTMGGNHYATIEFEFIVAKQQENSLNNGGV